jgi:HK97 family phage prohead protease
VSEIKNIDLEFKAEGEGKVSAVFSVFNTLDSDGDVVIEDAIKSGFKSGSVPMVWAHKWDMPIGKGLIKQDKDKATFEGEFFMDTESGKEAYNLVKAMGDLQQWSFGYRVNDSERGKFKKGDNELDARYLKDLSVYEVSPVLVGANQDTYTMAIKSNKELLEEMASEKGVLGHSTFLENEEPEEEAEEEKSGCDCNCSTPLADNPSDEKGYGHCDYNKTGKCAKDMKKSDEEEVSEKESKSFSDEVKDVLAALNNLMTRANAIAMLRAKDGRKIGAKATEALRAVQEDLIDGWTEIDSFISEVGTEEALNVDLEEEQAEEPVDVEEEPTNAVDTEEVAVEPEEDTENTEESDEVEEVTEEVPVDNTESVDNDDLEDDVWIESQRLIADAIDVEATDTEV